jgi:SAM-dependent methyltransferase
VSYESFVDHYDAWAPQNEDDVAFYVEQARSSGGPVVELGVGTGRIAVPTARTGVRVIGVDASERMLALCRRHAEEAGVLALVDLRLGDFREPPVAEQVPLVTCPFRSFMHLESDADRRRAVAAVFDLLRPGGQFAFDVYSIDRDDVDPAWGEWAERSPEVWERSAFDWERRILELSLRLAWIDREEWRALLEEVGFTVLACYGWFDRRPCAAGGSQMVWIAERPGTLNAASETRPVDPGAT